MPDCSADANDKALSKFFVNTAAVSPYSVLLALCMTSSRLLNFVMGCTGPKICWHQKHGHQKMNKLSYLPFTQGYYSANTLCSVPIWCPSVALSMSGQNYVESQNILDSTRWRTLNALLWSMHLFIIFLKGEWTRLWRKIDSLFTTPNICRRSLCHCVRVGWLHKFDSKINQSVPPLWQFAYCLWLLKKWWVWWTGHNRPLLSHHIPAWHLLSSHFRSGPRSCQTAADQSIKIKIHVTPLIEELEIDTNSVPHRSTWGLFLIHDLRVFLKEKITHWIFNNI